MHIDYQTADLSDVLAEIIEDGVVDQAEVDAIRKRLLADGRIDQDEAEFLFELNNATTANQGHAAGWRTLYVELLAKYLLEDETSPGVVDSDEAEWLIEQIEGDGTCDANEKALLSHLKKEAQSVDAKLLAFMKQQGI